MEIASNETGAQAESDAVLRTVKDALCAITTNLQNPPTGPQWTDAIANELNRQLGDSIPAQILDQLLAQVEMRANAWIERLNSVYNLDPANFGSDVQAFNALMC